MLEVRIEDHRAPAGSNSKILRATSTGICVVRNPLKKVPEMA
jgi:hypothetical protein